MKEIEYNPSCSICRDLAGRDRAGVKDSELCIGHLRAEYNRLKAEIAAATAAQRGKLFALCTGHGWDRAKAKAFADYLLDIGGFEHFTGKYISECIDDFTQRAADFEAAKRE